MPPKRRSAARQATPRQQSRISFHGKTSRVSKPSTPKHDKSSKKDPALLDDALEPDANAEAEPDLDEPTTAEKAIQQQADDEAGTLDVAPDPLEEQGEARKTEEVLGGRAQQGDTGAVGGKGAGWVGDEEARARKIADTQIKRYWRQKEQERIVPRVHQGDLTVYEKVLREWDMSGQYGVS